MPLIAAALPLIGGAAGAASLGAAALGAGASIYSANQQASAAKSAAAGQQAATDRAAQLSADATTKAADLQQQQYDTTAASLAPYRAAGQSALDQLTQELRTQPQYASFNFGAEPDYGKLDVSADAYKESPGLTTALTRGMADIEAANYAKGIGKSGAAAKNLADYATGTRMGDYNTWAAQQTDQFNQNRNFLRSNFQNDRSFAYQDYTDSTNRDISQRNGLLQSLYSIAGLGGQANGQLASAGSSNANNQSNLLTSNAADQGRLLTSGADNQGQSLVAQSNAGTTALNGAVGTLTSLANKYGSSYAAPSQPGAGAALTGNVSLGTTGMTPGLTSKTIF